MKQKGSIVLEFAVSFLLLTAIFSLTALTLSRELRQRTKEFYAFKKARQTLAKPVR